MKLRANFMSRNYVAVPGSGNFLNRAGRIRVLIALAAAPAAAAALPLP